MRKRCNRGRQRRASFLRGDSRNLLLMTHGGPIRPCLANTVFTWLESGVPPRLYAARGATLPAVSRKSSVLSILRQSVPIFEAVFEAVDIYTRSRAGYGGGI
jgi:hypothetical protein